MKTSKRILPDLTEISTTVEMPSRKNNRGSKSLYPFESLTLNASFGVKNKTAAQLASIISNQNQKWIARDENGNIIYKTQEITNLDGSKKLIKSSEKERTKRFFAVDVDPKIDPDGATVRIFRDI